mmetsp:Transcript_6455/g.26214  ORF Transcript_6455/g.26214 Transcript_6455/m.26214 type:complete len:219 (-) Transcript_6455:3976-4632(-)
MALLPPSSSALPPCVQWVRQNRTGRSASRARPSARRSRICCVAWARSVSAAARAARVTHSRIGRRAPCPTRNAPSDGVVRRLWPLARSHARRLCAPRGPPPRARGTTTRPSPTCRRCELRTTVGTTPSSAGVRPQRASLPLRGCSSVCRSSAAPWLRSSASSHNSTRRSRSRIASASTIASLVGRARLGRVLFRPRARRRRARGHGRARAHVCAHVAR